jgi:apolipoprotein N-acyltransferase
MDLLLRGGITPTPTHIHTPTATSPPMDTLSALQSLGLELPSPAYIAGAIVFGLIGMAAYWHGKRSQQRRTRWWGVALMFYPYAVSRTWMLFAVGMALCVGLWLDVRRG